MEAGYANLSFPFHEFPVPPLRMTVDWSYEALAGYIGTWSALAALHQVQGEASLREFAGQLQEAWGDPSRRCRTLWPLSLRTGHVE